jgi:hypothetical protein
VHQSPVPLTSLTSMIHAEAELGWRGRAARLWVLFPGPGMTAARLAGRVAGGSRGPGCSFLDRGGCLVPVRGRAAGR